MRDSGKNATYSNNVRIAQKSDAKICFLILPESAVSDRNGACPGEVAKLGEGGRKVLFDSSRMVQMPGNLFSGEWGSHEKTCLRRRTRSRLFDCFGPGRR